MIYLISIHLVVIPLRKELLTIFVQLSEREFLALWDYFAICYPHYILRKAMAEFKRVV